VELSHSPLAFRDGAAPPPFPWGFEWNPQFYDWNTWGSSFDYVLVRTKPGVAEPWPLRSALAGRTKAAYVGSRWKLYEALPPEAVTRGPVSPGPDALVVREEVVGTGPAAHEGNLVGIEYGGTFIDGTPLRVQGRETVSLVFRLGAGQTLQGIEKGVVGMRAGGERELVIPESMAYGSEGLEPDVPPRAGLILEVKLLQVGHL
jgi:FKBP-type peptidyl-prolyl cis-trans isomerase